MMAKRTSEDGPVEPLSGEDIRLFGSKLEKARSDTQSAAQECASLYKSFEANGGHKGAMQFAMRLKKMGDEKGEAFMRAILHYAPVLGLMPREDLVDMAQAGGDEDEDEAPAKAAKPPKPVPKAKAEAKAAAKPTSHGAVTTVADLKARRAAKASDMAARDLAEPVH